MAEQNCATRCASPSRAVLSADGWTVSCAAHGARRTFSREPETSSRENIAPDSLDWPAAGCPVAGPDADAPPVPQQAAAVDLQWSGGGDARQCAASLCGRTTATFQKATTDPWSESESQPRDEADLQKYGPERQSLCGTAAGLLRRIAGQGDEAGYGSPHAGTQDRGDYVNTLEKRRTFRRRTSEIASSLSVYRNQAGPRFTYPMASQAVLATRGVGA